MHASEQEFGCIFAARHYLTSLSPQDGWQLARPAPVVSPSATVRQVLQEMQDCFSKEFIGTVDKNLTTAPTSRPFLLAVTHWIVREAVINRRTLVRPSCRDGSRRSQHAVQTEASSHRVLADHTGECLSCQQALVLFSGPLSGPQHTIARTFGAIAISSHYPGDA